MIVVGFSHRDAPLAVRERLALDGDAVRTLLRALLGQTSVREAVCVSTCNRIEVYAVGQGTSDADVARAAGEVEQLLVDLAAKDGAPELAPYLRTRLRSDAVRHLFRVASSLDSLVVGEPQILGQMKEAFEVAKDQGAVGKYLNRAMSRAFHVAKRVRSETAIGSGQVSVPSVAVDLARQIFGDLRGRAVLLLGAGEMAESSARLLTREGAGLVIVNRSAERGKKLASQFGAPLRGWEELEEVLGEVDVVVASTSAKGFVVTRSMGARAMRARRGESLFFIDIAVPRDVEPQVNDLANVYLYDIDDLSDVVKESTRGRQIEAERAESLVDHEVGVYESWTEGLGVSQTIVALRAKVRSALAAELEKTLGGRLRHLPDADRRALEAMVNAAANKLLHTPTTRIKSAAAEPSGDDLVKAVHLLFDLGGSGPGADGAAQPPEAAISSAGADGELTPEGALAPAGPSGETMGR